MADADRPDEFDLHDLEPDETRRWSPLRWFLLSGNRRVVALALLGMVFGTLVAGGTLWPIAMRRLLEETTTIQSLFNTLLSGIILLVSIVVSINSVAVSQELGALGDHLDRIRDTLSFRQSLEAVTDDRVSPSQADRFLGFVLETLHRRVHGVRSSFDAHPDADLRTKVDNLVAVAEQDLFAVADRLSSLTLDRPNVLLAGMEFDYATLLFAIRFLRTTHGDDLDDEQLAALDDLTEALQYFAASREYFKTLFFQRELSQLSSTLLYISLPTIVFTGYVILAVDAELFPDLSLFGLPLLLLYVNLAFTIALAPYLVLTSYAVRAAFVARRSLEVGPFMAQPNVEMPELDWEG